MGYPPRLTNPICPRLSGFEAPVARLRPFSKTMYNAYDAIAIVTLCFGYVTPEYNVQKYQLDHKNHCDGNVEQYFINDNDSVLVYGESNTILSILEPSECQIKFSISSGSSKKHIRLKLEAFFWKGCGVHMKILESPSAIFHSQVEEIAYLSCTTVNPDMVMEAKKDNNVMIILKQAQILDRRYNFNINITLSDGQEEGGMTMGITIGVIIICVTALIVLSIIMVKVVRNTPCKTKHKNNANSESADGSRISPTVSYSAVAGCTETPSAPHSTGTLTLHGRPYDPERDYNYADVVISGGTSERTQPASPSNAGNPTLEYISNNLLPPCYDEAVNMPKPGDTVPSPQYENLPSTKPS
ncbi:hypothetical protein ScPMuIL_009567 [Solemya velum]